MKAFVLYLPDRDYSVKSSKKVLKDLTQYGIDAELFSGWGPEEAVNIAEKERRVVYPYGIKNRPLSRDEIDSFIIPERLEEFRQRYTCKMSERQLLGDAIEEHKYSTPGVVGCFLGHYYLWRKCLELDEPIMIFEDDVKFYREFVNVEWDDVLILALGKTTYLNDPYKGYLENPRDTPQALTWKGNTMPGTVGYAIKPHAARVLVKEYRSYFLPSDNAISSTLVTLQIHNYQMGRTTLKEEGNISTVRAKE